MHLAGLPFRFYWESWVAERVVEVPRAAPEARQINNATARSVDKAAALAWVDDPAGQAGKPQAAELPGPEVLLAGGALPEMVAPVARAAWLAKAARQAPVASREREA
jgi:hypothetical protein